MINIDYKNKQSIYEQVVSGIKDLIISEILRTDEKLPSVRELSISLTINPNTVQKAYKQLEAEGYIYSVAGKGNFVSPVSDLKDVKEIENLYTAVRKAVQNLMYLGEDKQSILNLVNNIYSEKEDN